LFHHSGDSSPPRCSTPYPPVDQNLDDTEEYNRRVMEDWLDEDSERSVIADDPQQSYD
jgi:hypothetical protein